MTAPASRNDLSDSLADDTTALGLLDNTYSPTVVEFLGELGLDFVWLDFEHGGPDPWDGPTIENLLRAAERTGIEPLVRIPDTDSTLVRKSLDLGVRTLFLPRVDSATEVEQAVRSARFRYEDGAGDRGMANPRAARWGLADDYATTQDEAATVGVTIETLDAVENIDDILAVPELGFVFLGPLDLSVAVGHPGEPDHEEVQAKVETVRSRAVEAGVPVGGLGFGMDDVNEKAANGYDMLNLGSTTSALKGSVTGWLDEFDGGRPDDDGPNGGD